ncbi:WD40 repeat domain-containing protein [Nonomuraea purpurea]|uniref:WD40 repeat domain-containing protein n=1 Tax=Nonomuraea purpurea TaxID=1849276 RepID=A0ABV8G8D1_9ACTN
MISIARRLTEFMAVGMCLSLLGGSGALSGDTPRAWPTPGVCPPPHPAEPTLGRAVPLSAGGHGDVNTVGFGRLGGRPIAVTAGAEGTVRFWGLPGFQPAAEPLEGTAAAFVDLGGRSGVLTSGEYGTRLWDLAARTILLRFPAGSAVLPGSYRGVPVLFAGGERAVRVIDPVTRRTVRELPVPGGRVIATGRLRGKEIAVVDEGEESPIRVWDLASGREAGPPIYLEEENATADWAAITEVRGRATLLIRSYAGVRSFDLATGKSGPHLRVNDDETAQYTASTVLTGTAPATLALGLAAEGSEAVIAVRELGGRSTGTLTGHDDVVTALATGTLDGRQVLLSGSADNSVRLWDVRTRKQIGRQEPATVMDRVVAARPVEVDGRQVVVSSEKNGTLRTFDAATGHPAGLPARHPVPPGDALAHLAVADLDGNTVAVTATQRGSIKLWDPRTATGLGALALPAPLGQDEHVAGLEPVRRVSGTTVYAFVAASEPGVVYAWDLRTRRLLRTARLETDNRWPGARELAVVGGRPLVSAYDDQGRVRIWDATTGRVLSSFTMTPPPDFTGLGLFGCSPALFAGRDLQRETRVLDPRTGRDQAAPITVPVPKRTATVRGRAIALVADFAEGTASAQVWDLTSGRVIGRSVAEVGALPLAAGDRYVVAGERGEQALVWPLAWP